MINNRNSHVASNSHSHPIRERVGLIVNDANAGSAVNTIITAEDADVQQIWMSQPPNLPDVLTTFAAAAAKTSSNLEHRLCQPIQDIHSS